jgi:serine/threonine protein kinase
MRRATLRESSVICSQKVKKFKCKQAGKKMINQYQVERTLGRGSFAVVRLCKDTETGNLYALKEMNKKVLKRK